MSLPRHTACMRDMPQLQAHGNSRASEHPGHAGFPGSRVLFYVAGADPGSQHVPSLPFHASNFSQFHRQYYLQWAVAGPPTGLQLQEGAGHGPGRDLSGVHVRADDLDETNMVRTHHGQGFIYISLMLNCPSVLRETSAKSQIPLP